MPPWRSFSISGSEPGLNAIASEVSTPFCRASSNHLAANQAFRRETTDTANALGIRGRDLDPLVPFPQCHLGIGIALAQIESGALDTGTAHLKWPGRVHAV
jgi:hypothetical protein